MKLVFATQNKNKLVEVQALMPRGIELVSLLDIGHSEDLEETADTLQGNALQKAEFVFKTYGLPCFADDTGLEIDALNGEPGVYSARYAGPEKDSEANMDKVLNELSDKEDRSAQFRTSICLYTREGVKYFEGVVRGTILPSRKGEQGFGYDPIFAPEGKSLSFAEMTRDEKNAMSHRGRAIQALVKYLAENMG